MINTQKLKDWVNENAPMLATLYQNKYTGMLYDRFASLPTKQQKQVLIGGMGGVLALVVGFLLSLYTALWSDSSKSGGAYAMTNMIQQYQKNLRDKSGQIQQLEMQGQLAQPGQLKDYLLSAARNAGISPRSVAVDEKAEQGKEEAGGGKEGNQGLKIKQANLTIERINLAQLKNFLQGVEFGQYRLEISSLKVSNDDKVRGYMKTELTVLVYLFQKEENA